VLVHLLCLCTVLCCAVLCCAELCCVVACSLLRSCAVEQLASNHLDLGLFITIGTYCCCCTCCLQAAAHLQRLVLDLDFGLPADRERDILYVHVVSALFCCVQATAHLQQLVF
jgi:hypothetical protein